MRVTTSVLIVILDFSSCLFLCPAYLLLPYDSILRTAGLFRGDSFFLNPPQRGKFFIHTLQSQLPVSGLCPVFCGSHGYPGGDMHYLNRRLFPVFPLSAGTPAAIKKGFYLFIFDRFFHLSILPHFPPSPQPIRRLEFACLLTRLKGGSIITA